MSAIMHLAEAIELHVRPGMHLHFASTPSRSNASVREVARQFRDRKPDFAISSSGFHSLLHLLPRLGLGRKYSACFFGDNYPIPRPNALYQGIKEQEPAAIEIWSLLSYIEALRAGALGNPFAITASLVGTDMAKDLRASGIFHEVEVPLDGEPSVRLGLVRPIRADIAFVHALLGDSEGNLVFSEPSSEGFWSTIGAKTGVIATVERVVPSEEIARHRDSMPVPRHQVLAIAEERRGAHPQPLYADPRFNVDSYEDDLIHYQLWRRLATDDDLFAAFCKQVLDAEDGGLGYRRFCEWASGLEEYANPVDLKTDFAKEVEILLVLAARKICESVRRNGHRIIIAGIGNSFFAARLAKQWLDEAGISVDVIVETGLVGIECGERGHPFLLSHQNMRRADRVTNAEHALGALTCGADNKCLGVIGAGQIDTFGNLNSSFLANGKLLVGSGGANDIATSASEVIVLTRCSTARLVDRVDYITSPGTKVSHIVTDLCSFSRDSETMDWHLGDVYPAHDGKPIAHALAHIASQCKWPYKSVPAPRYTSAVSTKEMRGVHTLDPSGDHWTREKPR